MHPWNPEWNTERNSAISDKVTVLVFKDNYAARTFQVPLRWISKFGIFISFLIAIAGTATFLAIKYYRIASKSDPSHVQELEQELTDLRINLKTVENKAVETAPHLSTVTHSSPNSAPAQNPVPATDASHHSTEGQFIFTAFPLQAQAQVPDPATVPIALQSVSMAWRGKNLRVRFALQYTPQDRGNQEGKILLLARGPETLLSYPPGTMNHVGSEFLLAPENGEFFSVSRYREVKADFGPVRSHDAIQDVEIFLFNNDGQVLAYKKVAVQKAPSVPKESPEKVAPPTSDAPAEPAKSVNPSDSSKSSVNPATDSPAPEDPSKTQPTQPTENEGTHTEGTTSP